MRAMILVSSLAIGMSLAPPAPAQFGIGVNLPGVSIGINLPIYPNFVPVAGYPVYYAPQVDANLFFYDGLYWVYANDNWYASSWYNGPWDMVDPSLVPYFVLRVPILYYRRPPAYFGHWDRRQPPRWGEHWGSGWEQQHRNWDRWDRARPPARAPLPVYQRQYSSDRYPNANEQRVLQQRNYRYQPREAADRRLLSAPPRQQRTPPSMQQQRTPQSMQQQRTPQSMQQQRTPQSMQQQRTPQSMQQQRQQRQQPAQPPKGHEQRAKGKANPGNGGQREHSRGPPQHAGAAATN